MHVATRKDVKKGNILRSTVNLFKILMRLIPLTKRDDLVHDKERKICLRAER